MAPRNEGWNTYADGYDRAARDDEREFKRLDAEVEQLRDLLAAYVADEDRWSAGKGEPYGSITTETGMLARAAVKKG